MSSTLRESLRALRALSSAAALVALAACSGSKEGSIRISWDANHESAVNSPGGGYRVFISQTADFDPASVTPSLVPYTQTSFEIRSWRSGTYYVRVQAFTPSGEASEISAATAVQVPES